MPFAATELRSEYHAVRVCEFVEKWAATLPKWTITQT
jgi:hypothetical protein